MGVLIMRAGQLELIIITGMSGAGKTVAMQSFEDMGYYTVDNMPPSLLPTFIELMSGSSEFDRVCVVMDLRSRDFFQDMNEILVEIDDNAHLDSRIIFLDALDDVLVSRYKESRRNHPLSTGGRILDGISKERKLLKDIYDRSDDYYDTSKMSPRTLRKKLLRKYKGDHSVPQFRLEFISFGFKNGIPIDADLMFDVRFLPNPYYQEELRSQTGLEHPVYDYVMAQPQTGKFYQLLTALLDYTIPLYKKEGKTSLTIAIGCTGGHHRSVAISERLMKRYSAAGYNVNISHRDINITKESTVRS